MLIKRLEYIESLDQAFLVHPVVAVLGPRQCGKTTLVHEYAAQFNIPEKNYFDLEDPSQLARLENPKLALEELEGLIVIDEIQRLPDLFPVLRVLVDQARRTKRQRYLILGSASRDLLKQTSETLAGRIQYIELTPFSLNEVTDMNALWMRGGFPESYLAADEKSSVQWRKSYIQTYLERDIPNLGFSIPPQALRRFWMMLVNYHGNIFNSSELGRSLGVANTTTRRYLDILTGTFMVRELLPWHENISKRQIKSSKIYFRDSGIYHVLLNIPNKDTLLLNPKLGASWEGMALEEIIRFHQADPEECYFWGVHNQAELDLLIVADGKKLGFEFKYTDRPSVTKAMKIAYDSLQLDALTIISPGRHDFPLAINIRAMGLETYVGRRGGS